LVQVKGWQRSLLDVAGHEEKEGAEGVRLGRAAYIDEMLTCR
jgi:hypothetical protein